MSSVFSPAAWALLAANLGSLILYLALDLSLYQLLVVYWWETVWIGAFNALKLLVASIIGQPYDYLSWLHVTRGSSALISIVALLFFGGKYLVFVLLLALVVFMLPEAMGDGDALTALEQGGEAVALTTALFLCSHTVSFVLNFIVRQEYRSARAIGLIFWPYVRCSALLGAMAIAFLVLALFPQFASTTMCAMLIIIIKLTADLALHSREHEDAPGARTTVA